MFETLQYGLNELGHEVNARYDHGSNPDYVFIFNVSSHGKDYTYGELPNHPRLVFVDSAEYGFFTHGSPKYANAFSTMSLRHSCKNFHEQRRLMFHLAGKSFPYFLREMAGPVAYPGCYHPIDYPNAVPIPPVCSATSFINRKIDVVIGWTFSHPWREDLTRKVREAHEAGRIKALIIDQRLPKNEYLARLQLGISTVSFDGFGHSSFRVTEALSRCLLVNYTPPVHQRIAPADKVTCRTYEVESAGGDQVNTDLVSVIEHAVKHKEESYEIYRRGHELLSTQLTTKAWAQYVLDRCAAHDWSVPTRLDMES